ncbi:MAG: PorT family protein, partial [Gemmatimonadota bacterium]|nr:PorT family protein [Gemmatimonadota bacterium]
MRTLPLLAIAALVAVPLQGQSLAVRGGMNWGTWGGDDAPTDVGYRMGFAFGAAAVVPLADNVALDIGAGYTQKGMQVDEILGTLRTKIDYIDLPIFLRVEMPAEEGPVFYLVGGPTVSFKVSCGLEFEPATGAVVTEDCVDADVKSWDVGATGGLGLDMEVG